MRSLVLIVFILILLFSWFAFDWQIYLSDPGLIRDAIATHKLWAPAIFLFVHTLIEVVLIPGSPFTVAGGLLFGTFWGSVYSLISSVLSSMILFWIIRYTGQSSFIRYLHARFEQFRKYSEGLSENGFRFVLVARLLPFVPNNVLSAGLPFTRIKGRDIFWGTFLGNIPSTLLLSGAGSLLVADEIGYSILVASVLVVLSAIPFIAKWRKL